MNITFKQGAFLSILIGLSIFFIFFDISVLSPSNLSWILKDSGDLLQHQLGSFAFRNDTWHFPITKTTQINYPEGISIVYTDSNLFLSIVAKLFKSIFPPEYQFWGIWYLLCWVLQAYFSYLIIHTLSEDTKYALLASILFCLLPTVYHRIEHSNLLPHWLILASIFIFIKDTYSEKTKTILFWTLLFFTAMIHAYLLFMLLSIFGVWIGRKYLIDFKSKKLDLSNLLLNISLGIGFILFTWILGYFYNQPQNEGLLGFGYFSMNINAIFNPLNENFSTLFSGLPFRAGQRSEGYQFLGAGILLLFFIFNIHYFIKKEYFKNKKIIYFIIILIVFLGGLMERKHLAILDIIILFLWITQLILLIDFSRKELPKTLSSLLIPALICLWIALSNEITIGETRLYKIEIPYKMEGIFRLIRSSGRFYWVTNLIFLTFIFTYFHKIFEKKPSFKYALLIFIISLQSFDMQKIDMSLGSNKTHPLNKNIPLTQLIENTEHIKFINFFDINLAKQALLANKKVNDFYMAHHRGSLSTIRYHQEITNFNNGIYQKNDVYLLKNLSQLAKSKKHILYPINDNIFATTIQKKSLKNITFFHDSISLKKLIIEIKTKKLVIISIPTQNSRLTLLTNEFISTFDNEFNTNLSNLKKDNSYLAIFSNGKLITDKIEDSKEIKYNGLLAYSKIEIKTANENNLKILINGTTYSLQQKGLLFFSQNHTEKIINFGTIVL